MLVQLNEKELNVLKNVLKEAKTVSEPRKRIIATDKTINDIVKREIKKYGPNANLNHIDVSNVTNMENMFEGSRFNGDISHWDVSNVTNMNGMFCDSKFNGDISNWDVSNVTDMRYMFSHSNFNGDISNWKFNKAVDTTKLGYDFTDDDLSEIEL